MWCGNRLLETPPRFCGMGKQTISKTNSERISKPEVGTVREYIRIIERWYRVINIENDALSLMGGQGISYHFSPEEHPRSFISREFPRGDRVMPTFDECRCSKVVPEHDGSKKSFVNQPTGNRPFINGSGDGAAYWCNIRGHGMNFSVR